MASEDVLITPCPPWIIHPGILPQHQWPRRQQKVVSLSVWFLRHYYRTAWLQYRECPGRELNIAGIMIYDAMAHGDFITIMGERNLHYFHHTCQFFLVPRQHECVPV